MSTYVMSDIHGYYDALKCMLNQIDFSEEDELYIIGDVVDRGPDGVKILQFVMNTPNVHMLLGNHEHMCMQYFQKDAETAVVRRWNRNGNFTTLAGFDKLTEEEKQEVLSFIENLPAELKLEVSGKKYWLVHGFPGEDTMRKVWNRPKIDDICPEAGDCRLIIGHTPVTEYVCPGTDEDAYVYSRKLTEAGDHFRILHAKGFIDLDCCVGYQMSATRLSCLRLDDLAEFYQKVN